jgi:hypothetical protein
MCHYWIEATATHRGTADTLAAAWQACHTLAEQLVTDGERGLMSLHVDVHVSFVYPADSGDPQLDVPATTAAIRRLSSHFHDWDALYPSEP